MKIAYCLNCEQDRQVENWMPDRCICHQCMGPDKENPGPEGGRRFRVPSFMWNDFRRWTQERQDAYDATNEAQMRHAGEKLGREMAERLNEKFWEAFMGAK